MSFELDQDEDDEMMAVVLHSLGVGVTNEVLNNRMHDIFTVLSTLKNATKIGAFLLQFFET